MSYVENSVVNNSLTWTQSDTQAGARVIDVVEIEYQELFTSGTGAGQVSSVFYTTGTLTAAETKQFDLFSLTRSVFGASLTTNFSGSKVKVINITNISTGAGYIMNLLVTGTSPFTMNFLGSSSGIVLYPDSYHTAINLTGFSITTGNRYFYLKNTISSGIGYQVSIIG